MSKQEFKFLEKAILNIEDLQNPNENDLELILDAAQRDKEFHEHVGVHHQRTEYNARENAFFEEWKETNEPLSFVNYGHGVLQDLFFDNKKCLEVINERDRMIVATVIQWLGSNLGIAFLERALARVGYKITKIDE